MLTVHRACVCVCVCAVEHWLSMSQSTMYVSLVLNGLHKNSQVLRARKSGSQNEITKAGCSSSVCVRSDLVCGRAAVLLDCA